MASIIEVSHQLLDAELARLVERIQHPAEALAPIGEDIVERMKQRFASATGPDGIRWKANAEVTISRYIMAKGGFSKKTGKMLAKGKALAANKRPLMGISGMLAQQLHYDASDEALTVGASMVYAAMQHFGGTKAQFPHLWGDIPSRPFLPITSTEELYPVEADLILEQLRQYLQE